MAASSQFIGEKTEAPGGGVTCSRSPSVRLGGSEAAASGMEEGHGSMHSLALDTARHPDILLSAQCQGAL